MKDYLEFFLIKLNCTIQENHQEKGRNHKHNENVGKNS